MRYSLLLLTLCLLACSEAKQPLALGTLERERITHAATTNEVIVALPVQQGEHVAKGALLVKLDDTLQSARVDKAQAELIRAEAKFDKLRQGARPEEVAAARAKVRGAQSTFKESQTNLERLQSLKAQKLVSAAQLDKAKAAQEADYSALQSAQEELLLLTNGAREEDLRAAEADVNAAKAAVAIEQKQLADLSIHATRKGILDNLPWNLGERVTIGSPLAVVLAGKAPYVRCYVPEPYRIKLKPGDQLTVHVDGLEQALVGHLKSISSEPAFTPYYALNQEERSRLMYLAKVQLPDEQAALPNGIPAQVELP